MLSGFISILPAFGLAKAHWLTWMSQPVSLIVPEAVLVSILNGMKKTLQIKTHKHKLQFKILYKWENCFNYLLKACKVF